MTELMGGWWWLDSGSAPQGKSVLRTDVEHTSLGTQKRNQRGHFSLRATSGEGVHRIQSRMMYRREAEGCRQPEWKA